MRADSLSGQLGRPAHMKSDFIKPKTKRRTWLDLLEVKGQICGDDADIKQVLHVLKLSLLEVAEDVQGL